MFAFTYTGSNVVTAPNENQVFVGSLPPEFTPETLIEFFGQYGRVLDAKIHHASGDSKKVRYRSYLLHIRCL